MNLESSNLADNIHWDISLDNYTNLPKCLNDLFFDEYKNDWLMQHEERHALISLLTKLKPKCSIEIGTLSGGSLSILSKYSQKVYTLDIDPTCADRLREKFHNVEFIIGLSQETLPKLLQRLQVDGVGLEFVLIDASIAFS